MTESTMLSIINSKTQILVNLCCGNRWHTDWINIDFHGDNTNVFQHNLREGLPLPDTCADFLYAIHCLEHFTPFDAMQFISECARVLKHSGTLRIVVPDLEQTARAYLKTLDDARIACNNIEAQAKHEYMIIELVDQLCRHKSGGEMLRLWSQPDIHAEDFIISRTTEYLKVRKNMKGINTHPSVTDPLQVGLFRLGGEPHQWMYDELSLVRLLKRYGFSTHLMNAASSRLDNFVNYYLDTNEDGSSYKLNSIYIEATLCE